MGDFLIEDKKSYNRSTNGRLGFSVTIRFCIKKLYLIVFLNIRTFPKKHEVLVLTQV